METMYTNAISASQPKQKYSKRVIAAVIALIAALLMMLVLIPTTAHAEDVTVNSNDELVAAVNAAQSGDTINLAAGKYTLYNKGAQTKGKDLTFVGQGSETEWGIGATIPDPSKFGTEYNGDYSFNGAGTITFKNMTLQSGTAGYLGFIRADNTVVDNCTINGQTYYWGYASATFTNTTFNAPNYEYAITTYSSPTMTFDGCTFNTTGKCINVYRDYSGTAYTINFKDCTVNNEKSSSWKESFQGTKQVLNINDSYPSGQSYTINISGTNTLTGGKKLDVCKIACSRLFGFGSRSSNNAGNTTVNIDDTTVFTAGKQVSHSMPAQHYTAGDDEGAYTTTEGEWVTDETTGLTTREIVKTCDYCGWSSKTIDTQTETKELPGDILINGNTEHDAVAEREVGSTFGLTGALQVSAVQEQMAKLENLFKNPDGTSIRLSDIDFGFTATLTVPEGMTLPSEIKATAEGVADTYQVTSTEVSEDGKTVTVTFALTDEAKANIKTYADLKSYVDKAGIDSWIKVTVEGVTLDASVAAGTQLTVTGTVGGAFSATATSQYGTVRSFSYEWNGTQWADGKDAVAKDDTTIQLTVEATKTYKVTFDVNGGESTAPANQTVKAGEKAEKPTDIPTRTGYTFTVWYTDKACTEIYDFTKPVTSDLTLYAGWSKNDTVKPDPTPTPEPDPEPNPVTPDTPNTPDNGNKSNTDSKSDTKAFEDKSTKTEKAIPQTGDSTSFALMAALAGLGTLAIVGGIFAAKRNR